MTERNKELNRAQAAEVGEDSSRWNVDTVTLDPTSPIVIAMLKIIGLGQSSGSSTGQSIADFCMAIAILCELEDMLIPDVNETIHACSANAAEFVKMIAQADEAGN